MELQTRKPNRLKNYDYSQNGAYFITICVQDRKPILSQIIVGEGLAPPVLKLLPFGECIKEQNTYSSQPKQKSPTKNSVGNVSLHNFGNTTTLVFIIYI